MAEGIRIGTHRLQLGDDVQRFAPTPEHLVQELGEWVATHLTPENQGEMTFQVGYGYVTARPGRWFVCISAGLGEVDTQFIHMCCDEARASELHTVLDYRLSRFVDAVAIFANAAKTDRLIAYCVGRAVDLLLIGRPEPCPSDLR